MNKLGTAIGMRRHTDQQEQLRFQFDHPSYIRVKQWLDQSKLNNYSPSPDIKVYENMGRNSTTHFVFSFKTIYLEDQFISQHLRLLNLTANNGLIIMATIFDQNQGYYIGKTYQKKGIFLSWDMSTGILTSLEQILLSFYIPTQSQYAGKNINGSPRNNQSPKNMQPQKLSEVFMNMDNSKKNSNNTQKKGPSEYLRISLHLATNQGTLFELGIIRHDLSKRPKGSIVELQLCKNGKKAGYSQFYIDSPDPKNISLLLNSLIPPYCIIDQQAILPPCKKLDFKNKVMPFTLAQIFPIKISSIQIRLSDQNLLMEKVKKLSPFFMEYHHQCIECQIAQYKLIIGFHNTWKFVQGNAAIAQKKNQQNINTSNLYTGQKNVQFQKDNQSISPNKQSPMKKGILGGKDRKKEENNRKNLKYYQEILLEKQNTEQNNKQCVILKGYSEKKDEVFTVPYFEAENGHLLATLEITIDYTLKASTISQTKTKKVNIFWSPVVFYRAQNKTHVKDMLMICHVGIPGVIQPNPLNLPILHSPSNNNILSQHSLSKQSPLSAHISYHCSNNNPQLQKLHKKQHKIKSMVNIAHHSMLHNLSNTQNNNADTALYDKFIEQLQQEQKQKQQQIHKNKSTVMSMKQRIGKKMMTMGSIPNTKISEDITNYLKILNRQFAHKLMRLKPHGNQVVIPPTIIAGGVEDQIITDDKQQQESAQKRKNENINNMLSLILDYHHAGEGSKINKDTILNANIKISISSLLPHTNDPHNYYIPRKMRIQLHALRTSINSTLYINKQQVKYGVPLQLHPQHHNKQFADGVMGLNINCSIGLKDAAIWDSYVICYIYDEQKYQYYGVGRFALKHILDKGRKNQHKKIQKQLNSNAKRLLQMGLTKKDNNQIKIQQVNDDTDEDGRLHFRIQIINQRNNNSIYGSVVCSSTINITTLTNQHNQQHQKQHKQNIIAQPIQLSTNILKTLSTRQRLQMRINNYNHSVQQQQLQHQYIQQYKSKQHNKYINDVVKKQLNNDVEIWCEVGKQNWQWVQFQNIYDGYNNVFTFQILGSEYLQIVSDKNIYDKHTKGKDRNFIQFAYNFYDTNNQSSKRQEKGLNQYSYAEDKAQQGYYQAKIPSHTKFHLLIKYLNVEYNPNMQSPTIIRIVVKRNTLLYKEYKVRVNLLQPLLDSISHQYLLSAHTHTNQIRMLLPRKLIKQYGENVAVLSRHALCTTSKNKKDKILVLQNNDEERDTGRLLRILLGFYYDSKCSELHRTVLLYIQILSGQTIKTQLGEANMITIPITANPNNKNNIRINDRFYYIHISDPQYQLSDQTPKIKYLSSSITSFHSQQSSENQPQITIRSLRPGNKKLIVCIINIEGMLLKKYLIALQCSYPTGCIYEEILVDGYEGEKFFIMVKNPYYINYGFYLSVSSPAIEFAVGQDGIQNLTDGYFKINSHSMIKINAQIVQGIEGIYFVNDQDDGLDKLDATIPVHKGIHEEQQHQNTVEKQPKYSKEQYVVISDVKDHVVGVYKLVVFGAASKRPSYKQSYKNSARGMLHGIMKHI